METYEIRILRWDGTAAVSTHQKYLNADAAITAARLLARGRPFEVWSDDYCVYAVASGRIAGNRRPGRLPEAALCSVSDKRPLRTNQSPPAKGRRAPFI
jgi:hypothetical protein